MTNKLPKSFLFDLLATQLFASVQKTLFAKYPRLHQKHRHLLGHNLTLSIGQGKDKEKRLPVIHFLRENNPTQSSADQPPPNAADDWEVILDDVLHKRWWKSLGLSLQPPLQVLAGMKLDHLASTPLNTCQKLLEPLFEEKGSQYDIPSTISTVINDINDEFRKAENSTSDYAISET